jgi:hypothetical protein
MKNQSGQKKLKGKIQKTKNCEEKLTSNFTYFFRERIEIIFLIFFDFSRFFYILSKKFLCPIKLSKIIKLNHQILVSVWLQIN